MSLFEEFGELGEEPDVSSGELFDELGDELSSSGEYSDDELFLAEDDSDDFSPVSPSPIQSASLSIAPQPTHPLLLKPVDTKPSFSLTTSVSTKLTPLPSQTLPPISPATQLTPLPSHGLTPVASQVRAAPSFRLKLGKTTNQGTFTAPRTTIGITPYVPGSMEGSGTVAPSIPLTKHVTPIMPSPSQFKPLTTFSLTPKTSFSLTPAPLPATAIPLPAGSTPTIITSSGQALRFRPLSVTPTVSLAEVEKLLTRDPNEDANRFRFRSNYSKRAARLLANQAGITSERVIVLGRAKTDKLFDKVGYRSDTEDMINWLDNQPL